MRKLYIVLLLIIACQLANQAQDAKRIVSLVPWVTKSLYLMGEQGRLVGCTSRVETVVIGFDHQPRGQRVHIVHLVVTIDIGNNGLGTSVDQRIGAPLDGNRKATDTRLASITFTVCVRIVANLAGNSREPAS